jgi:archaemetzincin
VTRAVACAALALALLAPLPTTAEPASPVVYIQPLGKELPDRDVALVKEALVAFYGVEVRVLDRAELPKGAFYAPRKRWRAEKLLAHLAPKLPADGLRILGLTAADISTTKGDVLDWGILGLATIDGRACVISAHRTRKGVSKDQARVRLAKVAVHEIGHTFGLPHCPTKGCLMEDAKGKVATTDGERDLCSACRAKLEGAGRPIVETATLPW